MLYTFKSKATADLTMLEVPAKQVLKIIGKAAGPQGVISPEEVPAAISALQQAIAAENLVIQQHKGDAVSKHPTKEAEALNDQLVSLRQRAVPFIHMLEESAGAGERVMWGI
ncbi:uncharacterized protein DUF1840 [Comamonas sp. BIGb0124]|uniref:DUF1840 domain-containing protein n=1 Tax=Comamonas sp. BIGb0124 TaxID=2485130 RepID=UPI000F489195|nr:DUF1840 domain-containing protein [Comamonas sp. BIGb0124]ROR20299.1 uncharacterized protein DUF1840 [Comamonas sp. BIGb0124]